MTCVSLGYLYVGPPRKKDDPIQVGVPDTLKLKSRDWTSGTQIAFEWRVVREQWRHLRIEITVKD